MDMTLLMETVERLFKQFFVPAVYGAVEKDLPRVLKEIMPGIIEEYFRLHPPQITIINNLIPAAPEYKPFSAGGIPVGPPKREHNGPREMPTD